MFGSEQKYIQDKAIFRLLYGLLGEIRYSLRLRGFYLQRVLSGQSFKTIWDSGCGTGQTSFYLSRRYPEAEIIGTDIDPKEIQRCESIQKQLGNASSHFKVDDLLESSFESQFDLVVSLEVLHCVPDAARAAERMCASLQPNGLLILHVPATSRYQSSRFGLRRFSAQPQEEKPNKGTFKISFSVEELEALFNTPSTSIERSVKTFGYLAMFAHTIYERTRSRRSLMALTLLPLYLIGILDWLLPKRDNGGWLIFVRKGQESRAK